MADKEGLVSSANNKFAIDMYKALSKTPGNVFFSPMSAHAALSMCYQGAGGTTSEKLASSLHVPDKGLAADGHAALAAAFNSLADIALHIANKVYVMSGCRLREAFQNVLVEKFKSAVAPTDFSNSKEAASAINAWVKEKTRQKIEKLFEDDAFDCDTRLVLVNAIYFKGNWKKQFDRSATRTEPFFVDEKTTVDCQMMHETAEYRTQAVEGLKAKVLELPYTNASVSMLIILPNEKGGIDEVESRLAETDLDDLFKKIGDSGEQTLRLALPKFKMEVFIDLHDTLEEIGLGELFDQGRCDLSEMLDSGEGLYVSQAIQKAFIEVNEEGAEAAAVTAIHTKTRSLVRKKTTDFIVDHPFLFSIVVKSGDHINNLFHGKVVQPPQ